MPDEKSRTIQFYKGEIFFIQEALDAYKRELQTMEPDENTEAHIRIAMGIHDKFTESINGPPS